MNIEIPSAPKDMDSEQLAKCLEVGADYKLYASLPFVARMHGIDMEDWFKASADRIRTLTAEVERLRFALRNARSNMESWAAYVDDYYKQKHGYRDDLKEIDDALHGGSHE